jgi:hypothetical protein
VVGGVASWLGTEQALDVKVLGQRVGGRIATIGPLRDPQSPWILLDRALLHFASVVGRAHAKRDPLKVEPGAGKHGASSLLDRATQHRLAALIARVRDAGAPVATADLDALAAALAPLTERATEAAI